MQLIWANAAALAVASIFYSWRTWTEIETRRRQTLRNRVVYMLWVMAHRADHPQEALVVD